MISIPYNKRTYGPIAEEYNELTGKQLMKIAALLVGNETEVVASLKVLRVLLSMGLFSFWRMPMEAKHRILPHIAWVFEKNGLTKQLITYYRGMYGPADEFSNLKMGEWNACEIFYRQIAEGDNPDALDFLVTVLFRKPRRFYDRKLNPEGDIREPFNMHTLDYYSQGIKHWPASLKLSILLWYDGCREYLKNNYDLFEGTGTEPGEPGMFDVVRGLCGERFGTFEQVEQLDVMTALRDIEATKKEAAELEKQYKNAGK